MFTGSHRVVALPEFDLFGPSQESPLRTVSQNAEPAGNLEDHEANFPSPPCRIPYLFRRYQPFYVQTRESAIISCDSVVSRPAGKGCAHWLSFHGERCRAQKLSATARPVSPRVHCEETRLSTKSVLNAPGRADIARVQIAHPCFVIYQHDSKTSALDRGAFINRRWPKRPASAPMRRVRSPANT
jgi:hypothetical protein